MKKKTLTLIVTLLTMTSFAGDILTLNNEMFFEGKVVKIKKSSIVFKSEGNKYIVPASEIFSVEFEDVEDKVYREFIEFTGGEANNCLQGRFDAEHYHGKVAGHIALGFLFGPFAMIGTVLSRPSPYKGRQTLLLSNNKQNFSNPEYLECYRKKATSRLVIWESIGWGFAVIILLL